MSNEKIKGERIEFPTFELGSNPKIQEYGHCERCGYRFFRKIHSDNHTKEQCDWYLAKMVMES